MPEECINQLRSRESFRSSNRDKSARLLSSKSKKKCLESFSQRYSMYRSTHVRPNPMPRSSRKKVPDPNHCDSLDREVSFQRELPKHVHADQCVISMVYLGRKIFAHGGPSNEDEILLLQQHAGGENLPVFKGLLKPNGSIFVLCLRSKRSLSRSSRTDRFDFVSRRHPDYPFAITCYINGLIDSRISTCCEMKHQLGVSLGGPRGSFMIEHIQRGKICRQSVSLVVIDGEQQRSFLHLDANFKNLSKPV